MEKLHNIFLLQMSFKKKRIKFVAKCIQENVIRTILPLLRFEPEFCNIQIQHSTDHAQGLTADSKYVQLSHIATYSKISDVFLAVYY